MNVNRVMDLTDLTGNDNITSLWQSIIIYFLYSLILFKEIKIIIPRQIRQIHDRFYILIYKIYIYNRMNVNRVMNLTDLTGNDNYYYL